MAVVKILPKDMYRVFKRPRRLSLVLTILSKRDTRIILKQVTLILRELISSSLIATSDKITMMKSNLFQLTCQ